MKFARIIILTFILLLNHAFLHAETNSLNDAIKKGLEYQHNNQYDDAINEYNKAIEIDPTSATAYIARGECNIDRKEADKAINDFSKAIEIDPKSEVSYVTRGLMYGLKGDADKAIADFNMALKIMPNSPHLLAIYGSRAHAYLAKKEYAKSWEDVHRIEALGEKPNPDLIEALRRMSDENIENGKENKTDKEVIEEIANKYLSLLSSQFIDMNDAVERISPLLNYLDTEILSKDPQVVRLILDDEIKLGRSMTNEEKNLVYVGSISGNIMGRQVAIIKSVGYLDTYKIKSIDISQDSNDATVLILGKGLNKNTERIMLHKNKGKWLISSF